jgi:hypothetical protein
VTNRKRLLFAVIAISVSILMVGSALLATDVYLHKRFTRTGGFNVWGYRGPIAPRKAPGEYRVLMLGGSTVFGYGVAWDEAIPAQLERKVAERSDRAIKVINLGYNNEGAFSFAYTLADYKYLQYDLAVLYEGYNDMMGDPNGPNLAVFRHDSPVFRLTGYLPIFPLVFHEKAAVLTTGSVGGLYPATRWKPTVFQPNLARRTTAEVLNAAADVGQSLERQLGRFTAEDHRQIEGADEGGCPFPWAEYCRSVQRGIEVALQMNKQVLVVRQPRLDGAVGARHDWQQQVLADMVHRRFGNNPRVALADLASVVTLTDPNLSFDRMHLTPAGNQMVAAALVEPILQMVKTHGADGR